MENPLHPKIFMNAVSDDDGFQNPNYSKSKEASKISNNKLTHWSVNCINGMLILMHFLKKWKIMYVTIRSKTRENVTIPQNNQLSNLLFVMSKIADRIIYIHISCYNSDGIQVLQIIHSETKTTETISLVFYSRRSPWLSDSTIPL